MKQILLAFFGLFAFAALAQQTPGRDSRSEYREIDFSVPDTRVLEKSNNFDPQTRQTINPKKAAELIIGSGRLQFDHPTPFISCSAAWEETDDMAGNTRLFLSTSTDSVHWASWIELTPDPHSVEVRYSFSSELQFLDASVRYYRLKVSTNLLQKGWVAQKVFLNFFSPGKLISGAEVVSKSLAGYDALSAACPCPLPQFVTRQGWNCPQGVTFPSFTKVTHLIVHHSASTNVAGDWGAVVLSFWNFHVNTNGWADIGYNFLIDPNGKLYEGRGGGENVTGAHFCGKNGGTMGICMIGTYTNTQATEAARKTLVDVLAWKACRDNINPLETLVHASSGLNLNRISGHRDGCSTECPGEQLYRVLPDIRVAVRDKIESCNMSTPVAVIPGLELLRVSPNPLPIGSPCTAEISLQRAVTLSYSVSDAAGRQVAQSRPQRLQGKQLLSLPEVQHLTQGLYTIQFRIDEQIVSQKIIIGHP